MKLKHVDITCLFMFTCLPLTVYALGGCVRPDQWLAFAENRGGCDNNQYMWARDAFECFIGKSSFRCSTCSTNKYHKRHFEGQTNPAAYPWQLGEDGRQICLECPKWTRRKSSIPSVAADFSTYDGYDNFNEEDQCLQDCPPIDDKGTCTNTVVEYAPQYITGLNYYEPTKKCTKCPAGKTRFSADLTTANFGVFPGISTGSRRLLHAQLDIERSYGDFQFLGYDIDDGDKTTRTPVLSSANDVLTQ